MELCQAHALRRRRILNVAVLRILCCRMGEELEVDDCALVRRSEREGAAVNTRRRQPDEGLRAAARRAVEEELGVGQVAWKLDELGSGAGVRGKQSVQGGAADELVVAGGGGGHDEYSSAVATAAFHVDGFNLNAADGS